MRARMLGMVMVALLALGGCRDVLHSRLSEREVNEMIAVLYQNGIAADKAEGPDATWKLEVPAGDYARAVMVLEDHGLPHAPYASLGQVFKREGLVPTPAEERIRFVFAQQQELENTLSRIDGVVAARVHVVMPQNDPLADKAKPASASIFIKHRPDVDLQSSVPQIKALVARSVEGLSHDSVSLTLFAARPRAQPASPLAGLAIGGWAERGGWLLLGLAFGAAAGWGLPWWMQRRRASAAVGGAAPLGARRMAEAVQGSGGHVRMG